MHELEPCHPQPIECTMELSGFVLVEYWHRLAAIDRFPPLETTAIKKLLILQMRLQQKISRFRVQLEGDAAIRRAGPRRIYLLAQFY